MQTHNKLIENRLLDKALQAELPPAGMRETILTEKNQEHLPHPQHSYNQIAGLYALAAAIVFLMGMNIFFDAESDSYGHGITPITEARFTQQVLDIKKQNLIVLGKENADPEKKFMPISFHDDYCNSLGWPDPYSSDLFTERQRSNTTAWGTPTVYTLKFVLKGREWRPAKLSVPSTKKDVGKLRGSINNECKVEVTFEPSGSVHGPFVAQASLIADGVSTSVPRGENAGRILTHDFLSLGLMNCTLQLSGEGSHTGTFTLPAHAKVPATALVFWVRSQEKPDANPVTRWMVER